MNGRKNGGKWHDYEIIEYFDIDKIRIKIK